MKSIEQHKLDGTYRASRHSDRGVKFNPTKDVAIPDYITNKTTIEAWNKIVPSLCEKGLISIVEVPIIEEAFRNYQNAQLCQIAIDDQGGLIQYYSHKVENAKDFVKMKREFMKDFSDVMYKFGITPAENPKVRQSMKEKDPDDVSDILSLQGRM